MKKLFAFIIIVLMFSVLLAQRSNVHAAEGGSGHYAPGRLCRFQGGGAFLMFEDLQKRQEEVWNDLD
jgi:hypothetical protein